MNEIILNHNIQFNKISEISTILANCWKSAYKGMIHDEYLSSLKPDHWVDFLESGLKKQTINCITAESSNKIIGISIFGNSITAQYPGDGEIISLYVIPEFIGKGIGHMLIEESQTALRNQERKYCILCVFSANINAIEFYKSHGFAKTVENMEIKIGSQNLQYIIMRKELV